MDFMEMKQQEIAEEFAMMGDGFGQYAYLVELSAELPPMDEEKRTPERAVKGCQSQVWLETCLKEERFFFEGDSDTLILRGILLLLQSVFNGQRPEDVAAAKIWFLEQTEIPATFGADRQKGIGHIIRTLQEQAGSLAADENGKGCGI